MIRKSRGNEPCRKCERAGFVGRSGITRMSRSAYVRKPCHMVLWNLSRALQDVRLECALYFGVAKIIPEIR